MTRPGFGVLFLSEAMVANSPDIERIIDLR